MEFVKRFMRHVWMSPIHRSRMFPQATLDAIEKVIAESEKTHAGEIRFVVEAELTAGQLWADVKSRQRAIDVFSELRIWDTEQNNGVLLYVLLADRKVEIVADRGIDHVVGPERWRAICKEIELRYRRSEFLEGTRIGIEKIAAELAHTFPANGENVNELPDKPVVM